MTKDCKRLQKITIDYHGFKGVYSYCKPLRINTVDALKDHDKAVIFILIFDIVQVNSNIECLCFPPCAVGD